MHNFQSFYLVFSLSLLTGMVPHTTEGSARGNTWKCMLLLMIASTQTSSTEKMEKEDFSLREEHAWPAQRMMDKEFLSHRDAFTELEHFRGEGALEDLGFSKWVDTEDHLASSDLDQTTLAERRGLQSSLSTVATCDCACNYTFIQTFNLILTVLIYGTIGCIWHVVTPFYTKKDRKKTYVT